MYRLSAFPCAGKKRWGRSLTLSCHDLKIQRVICTKYSRSDKKKVTECTVNEFKYWVKERKC
jgi:hypothetical protein